MPEHSATTPRFRESVDIRFFDGSAYFRALGRFALLTQRSDAWKVWLPVFAVTLLLAGLLPSRANARGQITSSEGIEVSGTVSVGGNSPLPIILVQLQPAFGGLVESTDTDTSGNFTFMNVAAGGYSIVIRVAGYLPVNWPLEVGTTPIVGLTIALRPDGSREPNGALPDGSATVSVHRLLVPGKAVAEYDKGFQSATHGKIDDAIKDWKKSIKIFPRYAESYMQLSKAYANRGDFAQAIKAADRAIEIDGKSADPYEYLGYVYLKEKDFPKAKDAFAHAVELSDSQWSSQFWLGKLLLNAKDAKGAYPHLLRASQLNPQSPDAEIALYDDLVMLGRLKDALAEIDDFLERFPNNPLAAKARAQRDRLAKSLGEKEH